MPGSGSSSRSDRSRPTLMARGLFPFLGLLALMLALLGGVPEAPSALLYFTTAPSGTESELFRTPVGMNSRDVAGLVSSREALWTVRHAPGFQPRGTLSAAGRAAWLLLPPGAGVGDPARLQVVDVKSPTLHPRLVDEDALYLQQLLFQGERLLYLRGARAADVVPTATEQEPWTFSLLAWDGESAGSSLLYQTRALWVMLVGLAPSPPGEQHSSPSGQPVLLEIHPSGPVLVELGAGGAVRRSWSLGHSLLVRDLAVDPNGDRAVVFLAAHAQRASASLLRLELDTGDVEELQEGLSFQSSPRMLPGEDNALITEVGRDGVGLRFPQHVLANGAVLYRLQEPRGLTWVYVEPSGPDRRLVPEADEAQDVSLLGFFP